MQQNKTNNYVYYFAYFLLYLLAVNADGLTPDYLIQSRRDPNRVQRSFVFGYVNRVLTGFHAQAVVSNHDQLHRAANLAASSQGPQSSSRRPNMSAHTKHAFAKRSQRENMVSHAYLRV